MATTTQESKQKDADYPLLVTHFDPALFKQELKAFDERCQTLSTCLHLLSDYTARMESRIHVLQSGEMLGIVSEKNASEMEALRARLAEVQASKKEATDLLEKLRCRLNNGTCLPAEQMCLAEQSSHNCLGENSVEMRALKSEINPHPPRQKIQPGHEKDREIVALRAKFAASERRIHLLEERLATAEHANKEKEVQCQHLQQRLDSVALAMESSVENQAAPEPNLTQSSMGRTWNKLHTRVVGTQHAVPPSLASVVRNVQLLERKNQQKKWIPSLCDVFTDFESQSGALGGEYNLEKQISQAWADDCWNTDGSIKSLASASRKHDNAQLLEYSTNTTVVAQQPAAFEWWNMDAKCSRAFENY